MLLESEALDIELSNLRAFGSQEKSKIDIEYLKNGRRKYSSRTTGGFTSNRLIVDRDCGLKWDRKPDSVMAPNRNHSDHSSCPMIAHGVERPYPRVMGGPPNPPIWSCSGWGLPSVHHH